MSLAEDFEEREVVPALVAAPLLVKVDDVIAVLAAGVIEGVDAPPEAFWRFGAMIDPSPLDYEFGFSLSFPFGSKRNSRNL